MDALKQKLKLAQMAVSTAAFGRKRLSRAACVTVCFSLHSLYWSRSFAPDAAAVGVDTPTDP
jgi:hypothetical protein